MPYETFDDFARHGSRRLLGAARLLVDDRDAAEDLTQEALLRVYRAWSSIRADEAVDSYAYRTLVRLASRRRRRQTERLEIPTEKMPDQHWSDIDDSDIDLRPTVRALLRELAARQRETLVLRFYAGLSVDETAGAMGCSAGTVKSQTAKGLHKLRVLLNAVDPYETSQQGEE